MGFGIGIGWLAPFLFEKNVPRSGAHEWDRQTDGRTDRQTDSLAQQLVIPKYFAGTVRLAVLVCFVSNLSDVFSQAVCPSVCYALPLSLSL